MRRGACLLALALAAVAASATPVSAQPFRTGVYADAETTGAQSPLAFERISSAGASFVRVLVTWRNVAPAVRPAGFDPANPGDAAYRWSTVDSQVQGARHAGLIPYLTVIAAPSWAQGATPKQDGSSSKPSVKELALFVTAAAKRYGGSYRGLPRVRYWEIWNEPNLSFYLEPQFTGATPSSPSLYRAMVNAAAGVLKAVHRDNVVIAGALSPFHDATPAVRRHDKHWGPLAFMRDLLCLNAALRPTCAGKTQFDAWSFHPYTSGGPRHHANDSNDLSLGDMAKLRPILAAARKYGHITAPRFPDLWVTEFSWDSYQPDLKGVPMATLLHWIPESMYRMWSNGVSVLTWYSLRDTPTWQSYYQAGLYFWGGKSLTADAPKPILAAFRFPFVALPHGKQVSVWGRVPPGAQGTVVVEQKVGAAWRRVGTAVTRPDGIFTRTYAARGTGDLRARAVHTGVRAPAYSLREPPDHVYNPFGSTSLS